MKIIDIRVKIYRHRIDLADLGRGRDLILIKIITDEGFEGISYVPGYSHVPVSFSDLLAKFIERNIGAVIKGRECLAIEEIWSDLFNRFTRWGRRGFIIHAISGVDIALWDILGKNAGLPLWKLLGGYREVIPTYANIAFHLPPKALAEKAKEYVEKGFDALKIRGARTEVNFEEATERIRAIREIVGYDVKLMVDMNGTLDLMSALEYCRKWERFELYWIEEPLHPDNIEGYKRLRRKTGIPIAAGEQHHTISDFKLLIESDAVDIIQPDASWAGGITEWLKIWSLACSYSIPVSPHALHPIHAQLVAAKPNTMWVEYFAPENPLYSIIYNVFKEPKEVFYAERGKLKAPDKPGLGLELK